MTLQRGLAGRFGGLFARPLEQRTIDAGGGMPSLGARDGDGDRRCGTAAGDYSFVEDRLSAPSPGARAHWTAHWRSSDTESKPSFSLARRR